MIKFPAFMKALESEHSTPDALFMVLNQMAEQQVGARLFTLMMFDAEKRQSCRIYSSQPDAYPVQGTKQLNETYWADIVFDRHQIFVANSIDKISEVFPDHQLIRSLNCESVVNVPIIVGGKVFGTFNCLHQAGYYTLERVKALEELKLPCASAFLFSKLSETQEASN